MFGNLVGTQDSVPNEPSSRPCIECAGTGRQNAAQQAIVDAINARVLARREDAA